MPEQTTSFDYLGSLVLAQVNGAWSGEAHFGDGLIRNNGDIEYFEKDHLGSVRVVLSGNGTALTSNVLERNDYQAYGPRMSSSEFRYPLSATNRYRFNGKERQPILSDDLLDYGARFYDATIRSWTTIDPLAEKYYHLSPYAFAGNNPMDNVDFDGRDYRRVINHDAKRITIEATYYYKSTIDRTSLNQAMSFWNNQNGLTYTNENGEVYNVRFRLSGQQSSNPKRAARLDPFGNSYELVKEAISEDHRTVGGITKEGQIIVVGVAQKETNAGIHEIGHTLGMAVGNNHSETGVMTEALDSPGHSKTVEQRNINDMVNDRDRGKTEINNMSGMRLWLYDTFGF